nr:unnamed protein product [Digitaria exilis]
MASSSLLPFVFLPLLLLLSSSTLGARTDEEAVPSLDAGNFSEVVAAHQFVVVNFYAPKCYFCKKLAPEYEKAATILRDHDPPFVFAKIDPSSEKNMGLRKKYSVSRYPTIKVLRNRGNTMQEYLWERDAESIAKNLKKQAGPSSTEIKSAEDAASSIANRCLVTVGIFPAFVGSEYENFTAMAKKLRAYSDFIHTKDASILPREVSEQGIIIFLYLQDFDKHALEKFVRGCGYPTKMDTNPIVADRYLIYLRYFRSAPTNAILFLRFSDNRTEDSKGRIYKAARHYGTKNISFLVDDVSNPQGAFQYFKLNISEVPLIFVRESNATYMKPNVEPDQILPWFKEYSDGTLAP